MYKVLQQKLWQPPRAMKKILLLMKLTTLILITAILQVSASGFAQKISISVKDRPLISVFDQISAQTGYDFLYENEQVKTIRKVSLKVANAELKEVLKQLLEPQQLDYVIENKSVIISAKQRSFIENIIARFQSIDVRGKVVDENNQPLVGATVAIKGKSIMTKTDAEGKFYLADIEAKAVLIVSFIGYNKREILAKEDLGMVMMELEDNSLDQVQVIAYGKVERRYSTSNIGTVKSEEIQRQPVANPLLALAGRVPGLFIRQGNGITAGPINVNIQGTNSIANSNDPFYVVDGVPYSSTFTSQSLSNGASGGFGGNPFNFINPSDIESISVLKDADATAIYGSRAANGAILISTKKGLAGKTNVNFNLQTGLGKVTRKADLVNGQEYLALRKERYRNDEIPIPTSTTSPASSNYDLTFWDQNKDTNWQQHFLGGEAHYTDLQGSVSGGSLNTQFLASYTYHNETTVYPVDLYDRKASVHFNLKHKSNDNRLDFILNGSFVEGENTLGAADVAGNVTQLAPNMPDLLKPDGSLNYAYLPDKVTFSIGNNRYSSLLQRFNGVTNNLIASNTISYELFKGITIKSTFGYNKLEANETLLTPYSIYPEYLPVQFRVRQAEYLTKSNHTWIAEPQIVLNKHTAFGLIDLLIGSTFQQTKTDLIRQFGNGYATDAQMLDITSATNRNVTGFEYELYKYTAAFGRLNYRLNNKYVLNLNLRRDGSSRFGPQSRFHTFYAIGGAWLFGEEKAVKMSLPWVSFGKLRGSYGTTGNDQITNYRFLSLLNTYAGAEIPYQEGLSLQVNRIDNPYLQWEETRKFSLGLDLGLISNKLMVNLTYARNRSSNQLLGAPLPLITGVSAIDVNLPALVQNNSIEGQLAFRPISQESFNWLIGGNITFPKNKLVEFPNLKDNLNYSENFFIGEPISSKKAYRYGGVNALTGLYQFHTSTGELSSRPNASSDRTQIINLDPKFYGGFNNTLSYRDWQIDFLFQFVKQDAVTQKYDNAQGFINSVPLKTVLKHWRLPGDNADIQKIGTTEAIFTAQDALMNSDAIFADASFVRLKNASISYNLPKQIISRAKIAAARIYLQGQNLLTITGFEGSDPEGFAGQLPPLKMLTMGLNVTF